MFSHQKIKISLFTLLTVFLLHCKKSDVPTIIGKHPQEQPFLELSEDNVLLSSTVQSRSITINTNIEWKISTKNLWIKLSDTAGKGPRTIIISHAIDELKAPETGLISVEAGRIKKEIKVSLNPPVKLISATGTNPLSDSITVTFNKPVQVVNIVNHLYTCQAYLYGIRVLEEWYAGPF